MMSLKRLFLVTVIHFILQLVSAASSEQWWIPKAAETKGEFLCTCSGNVVTTSKMNNNGRGCIVDNTLERHRYMCAYYREFNVIK